MFLQTYSEISLTYLGSIILSIANDVKIRKGKLVIAIEN